MMSQKQTSQATPCSFGDANPKRQHFILLKQGLVPIYQKEWHHIIQRKDEKRRLREFFDVQSNHPAEDCPK